MYAHHFQLLRLTNDSLTFALQTRESDFESNWKLAVSYSASTAQARVRVVDVMKELKDRWAWLRGSE